MIQIEVFVVRRRLEIRHAAGDRAARLRTLVREGVANLETLEELRGTQRRFERADASVGNGQREQQVRVLEDVVILQVIDAVSVGVQVDRPSANRNAEADFPDFVALAADRQESESLC